MSFHEKSAWVCFVSILLVFVPYFWTVLAAPLAFVGLFPLAVIALVVILVTLYVVSAITTRSVRVSGDTPPNDEMNRMINLRSAKLSGFVLGFIVTVWCLVAPVLGMAELVQAAEVQATAIQMLIPLDLVLRAVHVLFAGFVLANLVYYGSVILHYRGFVHG